MTSTKARGDPLLATLTSVRCGLARVRLAPAPASPILVLLAACAASVEEMLQACETLAKFATMDSRHLAAVVRFCAAVCEDCERECRRHAQEHDSCAACAESCARCIEACRAFLDA